MSVNELMLKSVVDALNSAGKYVSLDLTGSPLTEIPEEAFFDSKTENGCDTIVGIIIPKGVTSIGFLAFAVCTNLTSITIPDSVTSIGYGAFCDTSLTSVTFQGTIHSNKFNSATYDRYRESYFDTFPGDLHYKFYATDKANGTPGTYTRPNVHSDTWTKK
jgi:hypothetical protein